MADAKPAIDCRLLLVGNTSVGKSSLIVRFTNSDETWFPEEEASATIVHKTEVKGKEVKFTMWDTAGQERFRAFTPPYYRGAQGVILVYDVTNRESFEALPLWYSELESCVSESVVKIVVGNKREREYARQVPKSEGEAFARHMNSLFIETSAKTAFGVDRLFKVVAERIIDTLEPCALPASQPAGDSTSGKFARAFNDFMSGKISLYPRKSESQSGCCC